MIALLAYHTAERLVRALPGPAADRLAVLLARAAFHLRVPARRVHERNLTRLRLPPGTEAGGRVTREAFEHFALAFVDFLRLDRMPADELRRRIEVEGAEHLEAARASGRGVVVLSAHLGNWEWGAAYLGSCGVPMHLTARAHAGGVRTLFESRRRAFGVRAFSGAPLFPAFSRALRAGEWVALMGDRGAPGRPSGSVCGWAAALAQRTHALILPAAMVRRTDGSHTLLVGAPLEPAAVRRGDHRELMRRWLLAHASQWAAFEPLPEGLA